MLTKEFFETYPLYRKFTAYSNPYKSREVRDNFSRPSFNMYCENCELVQTYNANEDTDYSHPNGFEESNDIYRLQYTCKGCDSDIREFLLKFDYKMGEDKEGNQVVVWAVQKIGQNPPWDIAVSEKDIESLGESYEIYQKGLICESQGYGIGAFAYYRRVVEDLVDGLLDSIATAISASNREEYQQALESTKQSKVAEDKLKLVKELIPSSLSRGGLNPVAVLYESLSQGLHSDTDEECLEYAVAIRQTLLHLLHQVLQKEEDVNLWTANMQKLLGKKIQNSTKPQEVTKKGI